MKFFLDSANLEEIGMAAEMGLLDGVTTNPSLMAKEGIGLASVDAHYERICEMVSGPVSAEVVAQDYAGMVAEGRHLAGLHPNLVVKIPMTGEGIRAIKTFSDEGIPTNCTLVFSAIQALMAAKAGATFVSPFVGRLDDIAHDGMELIAQIRTIFDNYDLGTEILSASLRHTKHILDSALEGADAVTMPFSVMNALVKHPLTDIGLERFLADYKKLS